MRIISFFTLVITALLSLAPTAHAASAGRTIVECDATSGIFQQVSVLQRNNGEHVLITLNTTPIQREYILKDIDWKAKEIEINVPCTYDETSSCGTINKRSTGWTYEFGRPYWISIGNCRSL